MVLSQWWRKAMLKIQQKSDQARTSPDSQGMITCAAIYEALRDVDDAVIKERTVNGETMLLLFLRSMVKKEIVQHLVLDPLNEYGEDLLEKLKLADTIPPDQLPRMLHDLFSGRTILYFSQRQLILSIDTFSLQQRNISEPKNETTVLGPQDAFTESLDANIGMIRLRIHSQHLKVKEFIFGRQSQNVVAVVYMENLANPKNVQRLLRRLKNVEYDSDYGTAVLSQMIEDKPYSPFPQFGLTVRPDNAVSALLDGRIVILALGSPEAAICPVTFFELFTSPEDFYNRWWSASLLRIIRFGGLFVTTLLTSFYVALLTYHPEMMPPRLLTVLAESRSRVPFPPVIEVLLVEVIIEILREAATRLPSKIGQTLGVVGGIVIGTAVVEAGLASNIVIVLVAVTALLSFLPPNFLMSNAIRLVRYAFILAAGVFGTFGLMLVMALLFAHLLNLTSLGAPYLTPVIPRRWTDLANSPIRAPMFLQVARSGISRARKFFQRPLDEE